MLPSEAIRKAAALVEAGWCQCGGHYARDAAGNPVSLWKGGEAMLGVNPNAAAFTLYGAVAASLRGGEPITKLSLLFDTLNRLALAVDDLGALGGTNHLHPLMAFNEAEGRTKAEVLALLEAAAVELEGAGA